jgi:peptidyl-prolyl cis-trans isomerase SurA
MLMKTRAAVVLLALAAAAIPSILAAQAPQAPALALPPNPANQRKSVVIEKVLVRVNGEILTLTQLTARQVDRLRDPDIQSKYPNGFSDDAELQKAVNQVTPDVLVGAIDLMLEVQHARELGMKYTDADFKRSLDNLKKDQNLDDAKLQDALKQEGLTLEDLRTRFEQADLKRQVEREELGSKMQVTEEEERQFYEGHKSTFLKPATVTLRELFIAVKTTTVNGQQRYSVGDDNDAKARIDALRARAEKGEDFTAIVKEASESSTKANEGIIGPIETTDLNPTLKADLDRVQPGGLTTTIRVPTGYQILKLESRTEQAPMPFTDVRDEIEQQILDERASAEAGKLLARLRTAAIIEWKDDEIRQVYEKRINELQPK